MQQFTVPQFIDVEDKIIGPVTTRQFIIMLVAFLLCAISYKIFDFSLFLTVSILLILIFGIVAFVKINGRPFHYFVLNVTQTLMRPALRVWRHKVELAKDDLGILEDDFKKEDIKTKPKIIPTVSRLAELSLIVDTEGAYKGEGKNKKTKIESIKNS